MKLLYRYADLLLKSEVVLDPLPLSSGAPLENLTFALRENCAHPQLGAMVRRYSLDHGDWLVLRRFDGGVAYVFPSLATFTVDTRTGEVLCYPLNGVHDRTVVHLLLDQVLPLHLVLEGRHILHASAVGLGSGAARRAAVFMGYSGAGKSSTALGCQLAGAQLLTDDFSLLRDVRGRPGLVPADMGVRLWDDVTTAVGRLVRSEPVAEYTTKSRVFARGGGHGSPAPIELGALVCLGPRLPSGADIALEAMSPAEATIQVVEHSFRVEMHGAAANRDILDRAAQLIETVPVLRVAMPADIENLRANCLRLLTLLEATVGIHAEPLST